MHECRRDLPLVSIPRAETHLVVRCGPSSRGGLDVHALGASESARRKVVRGGQVTLIARLRLGSTGAVLGIPASAIAGRIVAIEDLWGAAAARRLLEQLAGADGVAAKAAVLSDAIADRASVADHKPNARLAIAAAARLVHENVTQVAEALGVSERHLRRVFREIVGVSPKTFAKLARFHRALGVATQQRNAGWAAIAAEAGYYDQAHLIAEFRTLAGVTPRALLAELGGS